MVEIIVNLVLEVVKCLASSAELQPGYLRKYKVNCENLKVEIQKLKDEKTSIQRRVSEAERKVEKIEEKVENWLVSANNIIDGAAKFIEDEETTNVRCFKGLCPNLKTLYQLSKKAQTQVKALVKLLEEARRFDRISFPTISEEIWLKSHGSYEAFESRLSTLKSIRNALTDLNVSIIGVYGMAGIGKTKLVKEVARRAKEDMLFDQVVFSEVSHTLETKKIQGEIAEKLGLVLHEEAESRRASRLYERLKNEKKILVVLDNIWQSVDLESVGIPFGNDHKGCKILLTARDRNVLSSMKSKDNFSIGILNEEEAWRLFKIMAGDDVESHYLKSIATDVAKACGGLPIAIITIARALRDRSMPEWENALQEIRTPHIRDFKGVQEEAYSCIELSYEYLKGEQLKKTFLLCSLCASGSVLDLFKYGMGMGLFRGANKMENAHNELYALVQRLKDSCLLLEGGSSESFSMHDVVRDVAISIACRDKHVFFVRNEDVWEWPDQDTLKKCYAIFVIDSSVRELPEGMECSQLELLSMRSKESFTEISFPPNFFTGMIKVRVVDFTRMQLFSLPSSFEFLVNLQTLCLNSSKLGDITIIGNLKNLEVLSLLQSDFLQLPKEIGQLTKLRLLDLTNCFKLKGIAPNVISNLTRLEELYMSNCSVEWEVDGSNSERSNASLDELTHLSWLTTLEINVKNDNNLPESFFSRKLNRFKISMGDESFLTTLMTFHEHFFVSPQQFLIADFETLRTLKLKLNSTTISSEKLQGIKNVEYLCLDKLQGVKNVVFDLDTEGFSQLKHLHVQNNPDFMCIVDFMERVPFDPFPLLESLTLYKLIKLERICHDQLRVESFNELKAVQVKQCDALSNIFLLSAAKCLPRLQKISVIDCWNMKVLFAVGGENDAIEKIEFAQLSTLCLEALPELTSFYGEVKTPSVSPNRQMLHEEWSDIKCSNEISLEDKIDTSTTLFNEKVVLPNLEALDMYKINVEKIWHNELPAMFPQFQSLKLMILRDCHKLKYIFSVSMVQSLEQLQSLEIFRCKGLREIISAEEADQVNPSFVFPQLTTLTLSNLPELRCMYPGMHTVEWPALKNLMVSSCDRLKIFTSDSFSFDRSNEYDPPDIQSQEPLFLFGKIFPILEELRVDGEGIRMVLQSNFPPHFFDRLKVLEVWQDNSTAGFPIGLLERFHSLENFTLGWSYYEEILSDEGYLDKHDGKLPQIKHLQLWQLNYLKQLWKQDSRLHSIFQYLEILQVFSCRNLSILLPSSSVSFRNITHLGVYDCEELKILLTSSTANGLVGLVRIKLYGCCRMTEVVKSEGNEAANEEIVFNKLKELVLLDLESLTSFSSGDYIFRFPSLKHLVVIGCPNMSIFTTGELSTPPRVDVFCHEREEEMHWDNDLNTTIQNLHKRKLLEGPSPPFESTLIR